jgi:PAS domain S-box-containing protein
MNISVDVNVNAAAEELAQLRQRLEEAEEFNRAIANGEVDAFVVGRVSGDKRVLLLANAYQRYRQIVERMHQAVVTVSRQGDILFANQRFARLIGEPRAQLVGTAFSKFVLPGDWNKLESQLGSHLGQWDMEISLRRADGTTLPVDVALAADTDGDPSLVFSERASRRQAEDDSSNMRAIRHGEIDAVMVNDKLMTLNGAQKPILDEAMQQELLDAVARQLRDPIAAIHDGLDMLTRSSGKNADAKLALEVIAHQLDRLAGLANDLSSINRRR